jgi:Na+-driven multidrug efflux pump
MPAFTISTLTDLAVRVAFAYLFVGLLGRHVIAISVVTGWAFGIATSVAFHMTGRWRTAKRI